ncbi:MAG: sulfatase [Victivallales bacterium]|jgi:iduronate 2-sulfatase|nr:sulfatase [Victivallales bacterium]MBT7165391.1 sulfatase [Victivallales bacterium]MBT7298573.1 sulfatase [Victivallales bacterium]
MTSPTSARPNILFIVVDDLRCQLGCYGMPHVISPNIDALAADGLLCERAYCQQAICAPSRASVLTGCRPDSTTIYDLKTPVRSAMPDVLTLPEFFKQNGYETISVGKVYHHRDDDLQGWCAPPFVSKGDWQGRGYLTDEAIEEMKENTAVNRARGDTRVGVGPAFEAADVDDEGYHDGLDASAAIRELNRLHASDQPFFLGLGFHKPHLPFNAPKRYWDMYDRDALPLAENPFAPEGANKFSLHNFGELRGYFGIPKEGPVPEPLARQLIHGYCACVTYMDAQLGRVMAELERLGLRENTVVIFWGDHGWKLGEHACWCKHTNFEIDTQAPLILSTPGTIGKALRTPALIEFVDMYPTLADLAGLPIPAHCEGTSFAPLLTDPAQPWKRAAFSQYPRGGGVMGYTIRTDRYRYTEWLQRSSSEILARELYDHETDPQENTNAATDDGNTATMAQLHDILAAGWQAAGPAAPAQG